MTHQTRTERLTGDMLLPRADELRVRLCALVATRDDLRLDLSGVGTADISFVQLLVSASRSAEREGWSLTLTGFSPKLRTLFETAGVGIDPALGRITLN